MAYSDHEEVIFLGPDGDRIILDVLVPSCTTTANGVVIMPEDKSEADAEMRFAKYGGLMILPKKDPM
jgi:hypothetical protein